MTERPSPLAPAPEVTPVSISGIEPLPPRSRRVFFMIIVLTTLVGLVVAALVPWRTRPQPPSPADFVRIEAGEFLMGTTTPVGGTQSKEDPQHRAVIERPFFMQTTPVTTEHWKALVGNIPSSFIDTCGMQCPVERVSWFEALGFANLLSEAHQLSPCYQLDCSGTLGDAANDNRNRFICYDIRPIPACTGYRLPTEREWEYAYRAGSTSPWPEGIEDPADPRLGQLAWSIDNANGRTHRVARKEPNAWGLYDMAGNVAEWVSTRYGETWYASVNPPDDTDLEHAANPVLRGGTWGSSTDQIRATSRITNYGPDYWYYSFGFRLVRNIP